MERKKEVLEKFSQALKQVFDELQNRPDQYVVGYYKQSDDSLIGYHASTFCQLTDDILQAKRYSGENPYPQLKTISENVKSILDKDNSENIFYAALEQAKEGFQGLKSKDIYVDATYLAEDSPKQSFRYKIIDNQDSNSEINL